ncbi:hypothetical protein D3H65_29785 [Paraflavitalea soli]|uniref:Uncharacterized protein n=1 Tax=Paraflavitalea soli TaxID=2315862 RepID=A0A3B7MV12_9BACT|nr:hypothetical protein D3H65_29785 [Paraflavitalea soli]
MTKKRGIRNDKKEDSKGQDGEDTAFEMKEGRSEMTKRWFLKRGHLFAKIILTLIRLLPNR